MEFGEGHYSNTESLIRQLLTAAHPGLVLPPPTNLSDATPTEAMSSETYVGYDRLQYLDPNQVARTGQRSTGHFLPPPSMNLGELALSGTWTVHAQEATAGRAASINLGFAGKNVYLVMGGTGTVRVPPTTASSSAPSTSAAFPGSTPSSSLPSTVRACCR